MYQDNIADTMASLDGILDRVEELIRELPMRYEHTRRLCDQVYTLWTDIEEAVELAPADFPEN